MLSENVCKQENTEKLLTVQGSVCENACMSERFIKGLCNKNYSIGKCNKIIGVQ